MARLMKQVETWEVGDEIEATTLIERTKDNEGVDGYELKSYKMVKKEKKSKGEITDSWVEVTLTKSWIY